MTENKDLKEEFNDVNVTEESPTEEGNQNDPLTTKREINLITDPQERIEALHELSVLSTLINTHYFMPKYDKGNRGTQESKIVSSVQLNFFGANEMNKWGQRVADLTERLGM